MNEEKEKKLYSLLAAKRPEVFWARQKAAILAGTSIRRPSIAWLLAPAAAAAALLLFFFPKYAHFSPPEEAAVSTAFLEHIDLLDDMDVIEAVPEDEL